MKNTIYKFRVNLQHIPQKITNTWMYPNVYDNQVYKQITNIFISEIKKTSIDRKFKALSLLLMLLQLRGLPRNSLADQLLGVVGRRCGRVSWNTLLFNDGSWDWWGRLERLRCTKKA